MNPEHTLFTAPLPKIIYFCKTVLTLNLWLFELSLSNIFILILTYWVGRCRHRYNLRVLEKLSLSGELTKEGEQQ